MAIENQELFSYETAHELLKAAVQKRKEHDPAFSVRAWSRRMGLSSNAPLSLMLSGKRPIARKYIPAFIIELGLSTPEARYLEALVEIGRAKTAQSRSYHWEKIRELLPAGQPSFVELESFRVLGHPLHMAILEMSDLKGFLPDPDKILEALRFSANRKDVVEAIDRLFALGLLKEDERGTWKKSNRSLTNRPDVADEGTREYHRRVSQMASEQVQLQAVLEREFNGYAVNIEKKSLPLAKKLIRKFIEDFAQKIEAAPGRGEETYQFNVQFFALTKKSPGPKRSI